MTKLRNCRQLACSWSYLRNAPDTLRYEHQLIVAEGDYVIIHGRFSGNGRPVAWIAADILGIENGRLAEHWDVLQDEATKAQSRSGLPMFGNEFSTEEEKLRPGFLERGES